MELELQHANVILLYSASLVLTAAAIAIIKSTFKGEK
jgi:hypothetical protein